MNDSTAPNSQSQSIAQQIHSTIYDIIQAIKETKWPTKPNDACIPPDLQKVIKGLFDRLPSDSQKIIREYTNTFDKSVESRLEMTKTELVSLLTEIQSRV